MALLSECMPKFARKGLDTADIVREAIFRQIACENCQNLHMSIKRATIQPGPSLESSYEELAASTGITGTLAQRMLPLLKVLSEVCNDMEVWGLTSTMPSPPAAKSFRTIPMPAHIGALLPPIGGSATMSTQ
jgi:hypothetical protein